MVYLELIFNAAILLHSPNLSDNEMRGSIINNQPIKLTMRYCSLNLVTTVCSLLFCSGAFAVGFGDPLLRSYLGKPLNVQVPITGVPQSDLNAGCIQATVKTIDGDFIASPRIEFIYPKLTAHSEHSDSPTLVNLITKVGITEPAIALSVALTCGPSMQRTFSLLLDHAEIYSPAMTTSAIDHAEPVTQTPLAANFIEPAATKKTASKGTQSIKRTKRGTAKKSSPVVQPESSISKKPAVIASPPKDELKISNEVISQNTNVGAPFLAETKPADIELQRIQENSLAKERFAAMLQDEPALLAAQATNAQNEAQNEARQKVQRLEMELEQLKLHIQSKPVERDYPMHLIVMNAVVLLLLLVLLLVVGKLYLSLRKVRQHQSGHWWNSPAEHQPKMEGTVDEVQALAKEEKSGPNPISEPQKADAVKEAWHGNGASQTPKQPVFDATVADNLSASEEANGGTFNLFTSRRNQSIQIEELSDSTQEAEFWVSINNPKRAIEILEPQSLDANLSMPVTLLYLLDLYRLVNDEEKYTKLSARLKRQFNIHIPEFSEAANQSKSKYLDDYEHVTSRCCAFWNTNYIVPYLESLLIDDREGERIGFDLSVYRDILFLISICKELDRTKTVPVASAD